MCERPDLHRTLQKRFGLQVCVTRDTFPHHQGSGVGHRPPQLAGRAARPSDRGQAERPGHGLPAKRISRERGKAWGLRLPRNYRSSRTCEHGVCAGPVTRVNSYASFDSGPRFDPGRGPAQKRDAGIAYRTLRIRPGLYSSG